MKVLITGGAGFIGSHTTEALLDRGYRVIVYDNFDEYYEGKEENIQIFQKDPNLTLIKADVLNYDRLRGAIKGSDFVIHLAAQPGVRFSLENPLKTTRVNVVGTLCVLMAAKQEAVQKVILASSSSVYGIPQYLPVDEKHRKKPISIYGASKLAAEQYSKLFNEQMELPVVILRYHTVYGPRQRPDMAIHKWTKQILNQQTVTVYGNGEQTRDFTYIDDAVEGTIRAIETEADGETFNIGSGTRTNVNQTLELLIRALHKDDVKIVNELCKPGDVPDTYADIRRSERILGYRPRVALRDGIENFVEWFKKNKT